MRGEGIVIAAEHGVGGARGWRSTGLEEHGAVFEVLLEIAMAAAR
jgi:hypothetical protein